jgi:hypothetical protein
MQKQQKDLPALCMYAKQRTGSACLRHACRGNRLALSALGMYAEATD